MPRPGRKQACLDSSGSIIGEIGRRAGQGDDVDDVVVEDKTEKERKLR